MDVVVAGANGQIGRRLVRLLTEQGHRARGLIRNPEQADGIRELGGEPIVADLEQPLDDAVVEVADAIVFSAGAGPGSGAARKETMDYGGVVKLIAAAQARGVRRFLVVSSLGAADPESGSESMQPYLRAKARADEALQDSGLAYTVLRPGRLTDEPGTGSIAVAHSLERGGSISRDDVAATLLACLFEPNTVEKTFDLLAGDVPIAQALREL